MTISSNTFSRACLSPENMIRCASHYTEQSIKEIPRFLAFFFTFGFSEAWYQEKENTKLNEFVLILNEAAYAKKSVNGNDTEIIVKSPFGELKVVESMLYGEPVLRGTFDGVEFDMGDLKTIDEFQKYIKVNLIRNETLVDDILSKNETLVDDILSKNLFVFYQSVVKTTLGIPVSELSVLNEACINLMVGKLGCNASLKTNLQKFLIDPINNDLSNPLEDYMASEPYSPQYL